MGGCGGGSRHQQQIRRLQIAVDDRLVLLTPVVLEARVQILHPSRNIQRKLQLLLQRRSPILHKKLSLVRNTRTHSTARFCVIS